LKPTTYFKHTPHFYTINNSLPLPSTRPSTPHSSTMHFTKFLRTLFLIGAVSAAALPDTEQDQSGLVLDAANTVADDGDSTKNITAREDKAFASVTTWSGDNCRGSSANPKSQYVLHRCLTRLITARMIFPLTLSKCT